MLHFTLILNVPLESINEACTTKNFATQLKSSVFTLMYTLLAFFLKTAFSCFCSHQLFRVRNCLTPFFNQHSYLLSNTCPFNQFHSFLAICKSYLGVILHGSQPQEILQILWGLRWWLSGKESNG